MNQKFLDVMAHEGPVTIVTINAHPASVVNTWMSYVKVDRSGKLLYYVGTINKTYYGMSFKDLPDGRVKLEEVRLTKDMPD